MRPYEGTAVYRLYDAEDNLLYVGVANRPSERWGTHASKAWWPLVARTEIRRYPTREEAERVEAAAILTENPLHNQLIPNPDGSVRGARLRADSPALAKRRGSRGLTRKHVLVQREIRGAPDALWDAYGSVCKRLHGRTRTEDLIAYMRATFRRHATQAEKQQLAKADAEIAERLTRKHAGRPPRQTGESSAP